MTAIIQHQSFYDNLNVSYYLLMLIINTYSYLVAKQKTSIT